MRPSARAEPRPTWVQGVLVGSDRAGQAIEEPAGITSAARMRSAARTLVDVGSFLIVVVFTALLFIPTRYDKLTRKNK
jgi:hypothetical protein